MTPKEVSKEVSKDVRKEQSSAGGAVSGSLKDLKRRQVFKPVLDNPFTQSNLWPFISPELASQIMDHLTVILSTLGSYNQLLKESKSLKSGFTAPDAPALQSQITIGFNSTISTLEKQASVNREIRSKRRKVANKGSDKDKELMLKYVFVTKYDITPDVLTQPFPVLSYTSSVSAQDRVKLVQLPRGSMAKLSTLLKVENVGIIGLSSRIAEAAPLYGLIESEVKDVEVPWLEGLFEGTNSIFMKPALSFMKTSAPIIPKKNNQKSVKIEKKDPAEKDEKKPKKSNTNKERLVKSGTD